MAIMRTNRLTSKTTPPQKTQTTKGVTVSNKKERRVIPASELEAQDAVYKRYQQDTEAYNKKMERYNTLTKGASGGRDYRPFFGSESNTRRLTPEEAVEFNKRERSEQGEYLHNPGDLFIETKNINVPKGAYKKISNEKGKTYQGAINAYLSDYVKPTAPKSAEKADWSKVELNKIPTKKATISGPKGKLKTRTTEKPELASFESPGVQKKGKESTGGTSVSMNPFAKGATSKGAAGRYVKQVVQSIGKTGGKSKDMMGYNRQEKQFKAYAGTSVLGESHIFKTAQDLNEYKKEYKSQRKEYRREGNAEGVAATGMEVKQARQAEKFVKGKQAHFNDENYRKTTGKTSRIAPDYRKSAENAANRNTMEAKLNAVSAKPKNNTSLY